MNAKTLISTIALSVLALATSASAQVLLAGFDGTNTVSGTTYTDSNADASVDSNVNGTMAVTSGSTAKALAWGGYAFVFDNTGTVTFTIVNTGPDDITFDRFLFTSFRDDLTGGSPDQVTIAYAGGDLAGSSGVQLLGAPQSGSFDFDLGGILTDDTLSSGETASFSFESIPTNLSGSNRRIKYDNIQFTGTVVPEPSALALIGLAGLGLLVRRRR